MKLTKAFEVAAFIEANDENNILNFLYHVGENKGNVRTYKLTKLFTEEEIEELCKTEMSFRVNLINGKILDRYDIKRNKKENYIILTQFLKDDPEFNQEQYDQSDYQETKDVWEKLAGEGIDYYNVNGIDYD